MLNQMYAIGAYDSLTKNINTMKKLLMSLAAVAVMSTAAIASADENKPASKTVETKKVYEAVAGKSNFKIVGKAEEIKESNLKTHCVLTVHIYNTSGQLIDTQVCHYNCYGANDMFYSTCAEYFAATIQNYQNYYSNPRN
jgi:hypothetical protein